MNGRSIFRRLRGAGIALVLAGCVLAGVSCESGAERIARLEKEKAEALAEAMRAQAEAEGWQSFNLLVISIVAGVVVFLVATRIYHYYSKANVSRRLIERKRDYQAALQIHLDADDFASVQEIIRGLGLPDPLQPELDLAAGSLAKVCHLCLDPRNTFLPSDLKEEVLASARLTCAGLFATIQRVMLLHESNCASSIEAGVLDRIAADIRGIRARLEDCLRDVAAIILQAPVAPGSVAAATAMAGILSALRDADRLLNGEDLSAPPPAISPLPSDPPPPARPARTPEKVS